MSASGEALESQPRPDGSPDDVALVQELRWLMNMLPAGAGLPSAPDAVDDSDVVAIIATALLGAPSEAADATIHHALAAVGLRRGIDRAFYYRLESSAGAFVLTHEWHRPGSRALADVSTYARLPMDLLPPPLLATLRRGGTLRLPQTHHFLNPDVERIVEPQGDRALALVPVLATGELIGIAGFAAGRGFEWRKGDLDLLAIVAQGLGRSVERLELDHALRASEARFRAMCDASPLGIFLAGPRGEGRYLNPAGQRLTGLSAEETAGLGWMRGLHPEDREQVIALWTAAVEARQPHVTPVHRFVHKNGDVRSVELRAVPLVDRRQEGGFLGILEDVTARIEAESQRQDLLARTEAARAEAEAARAEAEAARADVAQILCRISDGFVALDLEGRYTYANDPALAMLDRRRESVLGASFWELHPHLIGGVFHGAYLEAVRRQEAVTCEVRPGGQGTCFEARLYPSPNGISIFFEDITARKRHEEQLASDRDYLRQELGGLEGLSAIIGLEAGLRHVLERIALVAAGSTSVLISGETGTGKELVARVLHERSPRRDRLLVKVNCAAISAGLVESELFGHEKGAFTGAIGRRKGRFELAHGGTLFLDEIGELPLDTQAKLLRVLQERELERVGGSETIRVDVRVVAATNRDLAEMVAKGTFREDLYYRLNVFPVALPPLRERRGDIPLLVHAFLRRFSRQAGKRMEGVAPKAMERLIRYRWPGNVRELQNVIERAVILSRRPVLDVEALPDLVDPNLEGDRGMVAGPDRAPPGEVSATIEAVERRHVEQTLVETRWVIEGDRGAARRLGLHPNTLRSRLKRWGIARP